MRFASLRALVAEADTRARMFGAVAEARQAIAEMALSGMRQALADEEQPVAWQRVALTLADQRTALPLDMLEIGALERAQRRLLTLADLPEVTGFASYADLTALIGATINIGAPRYNSGDIRGCGALYWMVIRLIYEAPAIRGFSGYARLQGQLKPFAEAGAPPAPMNPAELDSWTWDLRRALDATIRSAAS